MSNLAGAELPRGASPAPVVPIAEKTLDEANAETQVASPPPSTSPNDDKEVRNVGIDDEDVPDKDDEIGKLPEADSDPARAKTESVPLAAGSGNANNGPVQSDLTPEQEVQSPIKEVNGDVQGDAPPEQQNGDASGNVHIAEGAALSKPGRGGADQRPSKTVRRNSTLSYIADKAKPLFIPRGRVSRRTTHGRSSNGGCVIF